MSPSPAFNTQPDCIARRVCINILSIIDQPYCSSWDINNANQFRPLPRCQWEKCLCDSGFISMLSGGKLAPPGAPLESQH